MNEKLNYFLRRRYSKTLEFLKQAAAPPQRILDLGTPNRFTEIMKETGYLVENSTGEDLDNNFQIVVNDKYDIITAFEIFEHLVAPYNLLKEAKAKKLIASVPLKQFFANAYWNENDPWDQHFHEFEPRQFDMLLKKSGWKIIKSEKWTAPVRNFGIRPILRLFVKRYYIVYCERI